MANQRKVGIHMAGLFLTAAYWLSSAARVAGQAPCSLQDVPLQAGFDIDRFVGTWYEIEWIAPTYQDSGNAWTNYHHVYHADQFDVVTGHYSGKDPATGQCYLGGLVNLKTTEHPAKMRQYDEGSNDIIDYWVISTDYTTVAIVYSCVERAANNATICGTARSWLWSRTKSLPEQVKADARATFTSLCMNMTLLYTNDFVGNDCVPDTIDCLPNTAVAVLYRGYLINWVMLLAALLVASGTLY